MATMPRKLVEENNAPRYAARKLDALEHQLSFLLGYACLGLCVAGLGFLVL